MELKLQKIYSFLTNQILLLHYTANSKKVVLRKSKIQITKYKIQEKVCHVTHTSGLLTTYQSVIYTVRGGISVKWNISKR